MIMAMKRPLDSAASLSVSRMNIVSVPVPVSKEVMVEILSPPLLPQISQKLNKTLYLQFSNSISWLG